MIATQQAELNSVGFLVLAKDKMEVPSGPGKEALSVRLRHELGFEALVFRAQIEPGRIVLMF